MTDTDNTKIANGPAKTHTDIDQGGWVARLPAVLRPYVLLARLDRPVGIWLLLLPGWWSILLGAGGVQRLNAHDIRLLCLFAVGAVVMRAAGCVVNDLWDRRLDAAVARTRHRPLAAGTISVRHALIFLTALLLAGAVILFQLSLVAILLGILSLPLIATYPLMKRVTWWPQLFLGLTFNFGALMGWAAVTGAVGLPALLLYAVGIFWTLCYDTIYAHQDREDDLAIGIKSTALLFGARAKLWVSGFYIAAFLCLVMAFAAAGSGVGPYGVLAIMLGYGAWHIRTWQPHDPVSSLQVFRANTRYGVLVALAALVFN